MRLITLIFIALVLLIQYPLWFGKGGWLRVHELDRQLQVQTQTNAALKARNDKLAAEVKDLKEGAEALEERARYELGMIKEGEVFVQIVDPPKPLSATSATVALPAQPTAAATAAATNSPTSSTSSRPAPTSVSNTGAAKGSAKP